MPKLTLHLQDGAVSTLPFERDLDPAEAVAFMEGYGDGEDAANDGLDEKGITTNRTYDSDREIEAHSCGAHIGLAAARWGQS